MGKGRGGGGGASETGKARAAFFILKNILQRKAAQVCAPVSNVSFALRLLDMESNDGEAEEATHVHYHLSDTICFLYIRWSAKINNEELW